MMMDNRRLFLKLLVADSEDDVFEILKSVELWEDPALWRPIGDNTNNRAIIGNQQEDAVSALAEKITNSVDAILINRCWESGYSPSSPLAPKSMRQALARFFLNVEDENAGMSRYWGTDRLPSRTELEAVTKHIWFSVTGSEKTPSITIADTGEGQTPDNFPKTFMALVGYKNSEGRTESQKANIPFVQGQFNMGGSGVYPFSSKLHGFQLLVSKRNPKLLDLKSNSRDHEWGFTVVRRSKTALGSSIYEYLAPNMHSTEIYGSVLSFSSTTLPLLPESPPRSVPNNVYSSEIEYGTLLKLYDYRYREVGLSTSHVLRKGGLMRQLELVLPECGLPVRLVEGRPPKSGSESGKPGSFQNNLFGILHRVQGMVHRQAGQEDMSPVSVSEVTQDVEFESVEVTGEQRGSLKLEGAPVDGDILIGGAHLSWVAFVFSDNAADRTRNGKYSLIYHLNGQKHAHDAKAFFSDIGYRYLAKHNQILVLVDCTALSVAQREEVFKPSRDRMNKGELSAEIQDLLKDVLKNDRKLQALQSAVQQRMLNERLTDKAPLRNVLETLLKSTPGLARFFGLGAAIKVTRPFPGNEVGGDRGSSIFEGKHHPTFLKFYGGTTQLERTAHLGSRVRLRFEIDVVDDYFSRPRDRGMLEVRVMNSSAGIGGSRGELESGNFAYNVTLPDDVQEGDMIQLEFSLSDGVIEPLMCTATLNVGEPQTSDNTGGTRRPKQPKGTANVNDLDIRKCVNPDEPRDGYDLWPSNWSDRAAVSLEENSRSGGGLTFFVNCDNIFLKVAQKEKVMSDPKLLEQKFIWSLVLLALSIAEEFKHTDRTKEGELEETEDRLSQRDDMVETTSRAMAQLILPMMEAVGALAMDDIEIEG